MVHILGIPYIWWKWTQLFELSCYQTKNRHIEKGDENRIFARSDRGNELNLSALRHAAEPKSNWSGIRKKQWVYGIPSVQYTSRSARPVASIYTSIHQFSAFTLFPLIHCCCTGVQTGNQRNSTGQIGDVLFHKILFYFIYLYSRNIVT